MIQKSWSETEIEKIRKYIMKILLGTSHKSSLFEKRRRTSTVISILIAYNTFFVLIYDIFFLSLKIKDKLIDFLLMLLIYLIIKW